MLGTCGLPMLPFEGPVDGMGSMWTHHTGLPAVAQHCPSRMLAFPGMLNLGKRTSATTVSHARAVASCGGATCTTGGGAR